MATTPNTSNPGLKIVRDATCTACGCACDDIDLTVRDGQIVEARHACSLGESWFRAQPADRRPSCRIAGQPATIEQGIARAAEILAAARYPLVYGLSETTCEAQRVAVAIGDRIGANVDTTTSLRHGPAGVSFQGVGEVTSSLGEVANRGDMIICWGCDPVVSHPRHFARYSLQPKGMFLPGGRTDRTCVVVDVRRTASADEADVFLEIAAGADFEALWILRALAAGVTLDAGRVDAETGVTLDAWQDLISRMKRARFGVMLFGLGITMTRGKYLNSEALLALVRDMNAHTRFVALPMRGPGNVAGADNVVTWQTGSPFGVNLSRGYPRFNPGEYTAEEVLARGEVDVALIVGSGSTDEFGPAARARLAAIPCVTLDREDTSLTSNAAVAFATATCGAHVGGTIYRMDDVPILLRPALDSPHPSDFEVLTALETAISSRR